MNGFLMGLWTLGTFDGTMIVEGWKKGIIGQRLQIKEKSLILEQS